MELDVVTKEELKELKDSLEHKMDTVLLALEAAKPVFDEKEDEQFFLKDIEVETLAPSKKDMLDCDYVTVDGRNARGRHFKAFKQKAGHVGGAIWEVTRIGGRINKRGWVFRTDENNPSQSEETQVKKCIAWHDDDNLKKDKVNG